MVGRFLCALTGAALLVCTPAAALAQSQPSEPSEQEMEQTFAMLSGVFELEPLTAEQEARLPLAREIVEKVMPEGAMMEVMGSTFASVLGPIEQMANADTATALSSSLGYRPAELDLDEEETAEILKLIDPAWQDRTAALSSVTTSMMTDMTTRMEPLMRDVMGELYAIYFDAEELADINAFFATESGSSFARQSYAMAGDPRIMAAMFQDPEVMLGAVAQMPVAMEAALADIPEAREFEQLSPEARRRVMELTGLSAEELREALAAAAEMRASGM